MVRLFLSFFLFCSLTTQAQQILPPQEAFKPSAHAIDGQTLEVRFAIADGYYLYRDKFAFAATSGLLAASAEPVALTFDATQMPQGQEKNDETFGKVSVYYQEVAIRIPVERNSSGPLALSLQVTSQGCADIGLCYPPEKQNLRVELPDPNTATPVVTPNENPKSPKSPKISATSSSNDESGRIAKLLENANFWLVALSFFGFGLLLSLTPCVFPMLPIVSGIIINAGSASKRVSPVRGFVLSLAYVLGMCATYTAVGVAAGFSGTLLSAALQTPWALSAFALIFVALACAMFGFYELQLPTFLQSKVASESAQIQGGSLPAVALMGALSALIVGPCVAAPLAGALLYIGQTGNAWLGGFALFCLSFGMGAPLLAIGASAGTLLPKSGAWMKKVKQVFGFIMLGTAIWIISPLFSVPLQMSAWALLLIVAAVYLHALDALPPQSQGALRLLKGIGVIFLLLGAAMLVGALSGARDPWQPLAGLGASSASSVNSSTQNSSASLSFERVQDLAELEVILQTSGKPVMLDFYADWCVSCKEMERYTFSDLAVQQKLAGFRLLKADLTANTAADKALLARFKLFGPPGIVFFNATGAEIKNVRVVGFQNARDFLQTLQTLAL